MKNRFDLHLPEASELSHGKGPLSLPDLLTTRSGLTVDSAKIWEKMRRTEILELFRKHVYGREPLGHPVMSFELLETDEKGLGGRATRKQVRVHLSGDADVLSMDILIYLPNERVRPVKLFPD